MSILPYKRWFVLPFLAPFFAFGQYTPTESPIQEGVGQTQITLPAGYLIYKILKPPYDSISGNVVGTFVSSASQTTSNGNTFFFTANSNDYYGTFYVDWNGTDATGVEVSHTSINGSNEYVGVVVDPTDDEPVLKTGVTNASNTNASASYSVSEGSRFVCLGSATDVDGGDPSIVVSGGADQALFTFSGGQLTFNSSSGFDYEFPLDNGGNNVYEVTLTAEDPQGAVGFDVDQDITITVLNTNDPPTITNGNDDLVFTIDEEENSITWEDAVGTSFALYVSDLDSSNFTWVRASEPKNGTLTIDDQNDHCLVNYEPDPDFWGTNIASSPVAGVNGVADKFIIRVSDQSGASDEITFRVKVEPINDDAPTITSNTSINHQENDTSSITLSASDPDEDPQLTWSITGGDDAGKFDITSGGELSFVSDDDIDYEANNSYNSSNVYSFRAQVTDQNGQFDSEIITITVVDLNEAPVIQQPDPYQVTMFEDNASSFSPYLNAIDPDLYSSNAAWNTLSWRLLTSPSNGQASISGSGAVPTSFSYVPNSNYHGSDSFSVKVQDNQYSDTIVFNVTIEPSDDLPEFSPSLHGGNALVTLQIPENTTNEVFQVSATDPDGGTVSYSIHHGLDEQFFEVDSVSGWVSFVSSFSPDFENPVDSNALNTYEVTIAASDENGTSYQIFTLEITDEYESPFFVSSSTFTTTENQHVAATVEVDDIDANDAHTFSIMPQSSYSDDAGKFTVDADTGIISFLVPPDFEANGSVAGTNAYNLTIRAYDLGGAHADQNITINVVDGNDQPSLTEGNLNATLISLEESAIIGSVVADFNVTDQDPSQSHFWTLSGPDAVFFDIDSSNGQLELAAFLDYENPSDENADNFYELILIATDSHSSPSESEPFALQILVTNVNEPPFLSGSFDVSISMFEDNASSFVSPTWVAIDPETNSDLGIAWALIDEQGEKVNQLTTAQTGSTVRIDPVDGTLTFLPVANANRYKTASDFFLVSFEDSGGLEDNVTVQVAIEAVNDLPEIVGDFSNTIDHPEGTLEVIDFNGSDFNDEDANNFDPHYTADAYLTWQIGGADADSFFISNQGTLRFRSVPSYDSSTPENNRFEINVVLSDAYGGVSTYPLTIDVINSQEPPVLLTTLSTIQISEDENPISWESVWNGVEVEDPEDANLLWSVLTNGVYGVAEIEENTGEIDYVPNPNQFGNDSFVVNVNDGYFDLNFTINVKIIQQNDPPRIDDLDPSGFSGQELSWPENTPAVTTIKSFVTDDSEDNQSADYSSANFSWSLGGADANQFTLDINGNLRFKRSMDYENPRDADSDNLYEIVVRATDNSVDYSEYPLSVRVSNQNDPPVFESLEGASDAFVEIYENETFLYTAVALPVDENAIEITYLKGGGDDDDLFSINELNGEIRFINAPNFENPADNDGDGVYLLEVNASDGLSEATQKVTITVLDANENPSFSSPASNHQHYESDSVLVGFDASQFVNDDDGAPSYLFSLDFSLSSDNQYFSINSATGSLSFAEDFSPDYEIPLDADSNNIYDLIVTIVDEGTTIQGGLSLQIMDSSDPPVIEGSDLNQLTVDENTVFVKTLVASDQDSLNSFADVLIVVDDESIGWSRNEETNEVQFSGINYISDPAAGASFCMSADFDRDGDVDAILLQKSQGKVVLFENNGDGSFSSADELYVISQSDPHYGVVGDFNEDGYPDFAVAMEGLTDLVVFVNNAVADIGFSEVEIPVGGSVSALEVGDVDSDGDLDLIVISQDSVSLKDEILWFSNDGPLWFENPNQSLGFSEGSILSFGILEVNRPKFLSLGDADQDGDADLVVASSQDGNFNLFLNDGNGTFAAPMLLHQEQDGEAHGVKFEDLNNDGKLDLVLSTKSPSKFGVMLQSTKGGGEFQSPSFFYNSSFFVNAFDFGDMDRDGDVDIVAATFADGNLRCFLNDGNGRFSLSDQNILSGQDSIVSISVDDFSQTNSILEFSIRADYKDWERFVFRPRYSGNLFFKEVPDFENINDVGKDHQFEIKVVATDDESNPNAGTERLIVVNVDNVYEAPVITEPSAGEALELAVPEHTTYVIDVNSTNDEELDLDEETHYSISGGVDADFFEIDEFSGVLRFKKGPDFENPEDNDARGYNSYDLVVRATDDGPQQSFSERVIRVQVLDDNDLPVFDPAPSNLSHDLLEDSNLSLSLSLLNAFDPEGGSLNWSVIESPQSGVETLGPSTLFYQPNPDFHGTDQVTLQIEDDAFLTARLTVEFVVQPVNDGPVVSTASLISHPENERVVLTLEADDVEDDDLTWRLIGGLDAERFQLSNSGILSFIATAPDYENPDSNSSDTNYEIQVSVSDGEIQAIRNFTIEVIDVPDIPPVVHNLEADSTTRLAVPEGETFVLDLNFSDVEDNNLTLSLSGGEDKDLFHLYPSGSLIFLSAPDFETPIDQNGDNLYLVDLNVTDGANPIQRSILVQVVNANEEEPRFDQDLGSKGNPFMHPENQPLVTVLQVEDDTNESLFFSLVGGVDQDEFEINATSGELRFKDEFLPDYEVKGSLDEDNVYELRIEVSDGTYKSTSDMFIGISNLNEPPALTQSIFEVYEDQPKDLMVAVFDPEGDSFEWDFLRSPNHGALSLIEGGYRYTPKQDYNGLDEVHFIAYDDQNESYELNASIVVHPQNDDPTAVDDEVDFDRNAYSTLNVGVLGNDSSAPDEDEVLEVSDWSNKTDSTLSFDADSQSFHFTPAADFIGPYVFTYTLFDGSRTAKATVTINVGNRARASLDRDPWKYVSGFGYFTENKYPWILHAQIGWVYLSVPGGENTVTWMWNEDIGWFWTGRDYFPYFFVDDTQKWYTWEGGIYDPNGVAIYDFTADTYVTLDDFQKQRILTVVGNLTGNTQGLIDFVSSSDFFNKEEVGKILTELYLSGQSSTLQNLLK